MKGIDVSKYQKQIDWGKVDASGIDFALIRIGMGNVISQEDPYFDTNVTQALAHGLYVGGYYFSYATSVADAQKEADVCNEILQSYRGKLLFPIAYDYEYDSYNYFVRTIGRAPTNAEIDSLINAFNDRLASYGWFVNTYMNGDYIRSGKISTATMKKYDAWLADYSGAPDYPCYIQQTGSKGTVPGITGNVDMDVSFKDYPTIIQAGGFNGYPKPQISTVGIDTTMDVTKSRGQWYQVKCTCPQQPALTFGTADVVTILPPEHIGNDWFYYIVPIGKPGQETGIFTAAPGEQPLKRFVFKIK